VAAFYQGFSRVFHGFFLTFWLLGFQGIVSISAAPPGPAGAAVRGVDYSGGALAEEVSAGV